MAWYKDVFAAEDPLRFEMYGISDESRQHVDFVVEKLGLEPGMRVLDLCCGQGRHLIDLVQRGCDAVGVDLSGYMLGKCREAAAELGLRLNLVESDMRDIKFDAQFDAAINLFTSFGYLESDEEDQKVLDAVSRALRPGGKFLLDTINRERLIRHFMSRMWEENSRGDVTISSYTFDITTGRETTCETTIFRDGRRQESSHTIRLYAYTELARMFSAAGLEMETAYGGYDGSELTTDSHRMIVVARKGA